MLLLLALLAAAQPPETQEDRPADPAPPTAQPQESPPTPPAPPVPSGPAPAAHLEERDANLHFTYSWPGDIQDAPILQSRFEGRRDRARMEARQAAQDRPANASGGPRPAYDFGTSWTRQGRSDQLLVLLANIYTNTGGARGETRFEGLMWDMANNAVVTPEEVFGTSDWASRYAARYCTALAAARVARREETAPTQAQTTPAESTASPTTPSEPAPSTESRLPSLDDLPPPEADTPAPQPQTKRAVQQDPGPPTAGEPTDPGPAPEPACPDIGTLIALPADTNGNGRFDHLRVFVPPTVEGATVEQAYMPDIRFTAADVAAIAEPWRASFEAEPVRRQATRPTPRRTPTRRAPSRRR